MGNAEKIKEKQEAQNIANAKKVAQLTQCVAIASSTPEGIITFRQIMHMCGYNQSIVSANPQGDINLNGTVYNAARENIWKELRQLIPVKARKKIEYEQTVFKEEDND